MLKHEEILQNIIYRYQEPYGNLKSTTFENKWQDYFFNMILILILFLIILQFTLSMYHVLVKIEASFRHFGTTCYIQSTL